MTAQAPAETSARLRLLGLRGPVWRYGAASGDVHVKEVSVSVPPGRSATRVGRGGAVAATRAPGLATVQGVRAEPARLLVTIDLPDGPSLADVVRRAGPTPLHALRPVLHQLAETLAAVHRAGHALGGLAAADVLWLPSGRLLVADVVLSDPALQALAMRPEAEHEAFVAPEGGDRATAGQDVYAWGALARALATGRLERSVEAVTSGPVTGDAALDALVRACLSADPATRPRDAGVLLESMVGPEAPARGPDGHPTDRQRSATTAPREQPAPAARAPAARPPGRRRRVVVVALLSVLALAAVAGGALLAWRYRDGGLSTSVPTARVLPDAAPASSPPPPPAAPVEAVTATSVLYRIATPDGACLELRQEAGGASASVYCSLSGSILGGDGQAADADGIRWLRVHEPVGDRWAWGPADRLLPFASVGAPSPAPGTTVDPATVQVTASSELAPVDDLTYAAANTLDGNLQTAWNHNSLRGGPIGQALTYRFPQPVDLAAIVLVNGYAKTPAAFADNARVGNLTVRAASGTHVRALVDTREPQRLDLPLGPVTEVILEVSGVYPGRLHPDVALTDVSFVLAPPA